ncbi:MAG: Gldg family protein [Bacteroidales bacterium]|nr:Gldg family protein [Bacteroidales bacterium]
MKTKSTILYTLAMVVGIIILLNYLSNRFFFRLDLTDDSRYSLSPATKNILRSLEQPVTITAYFTKKLPPQFENLKRDFKNMLTDYKTISKGMVVYEFIDPAVDEETERKVQQKGIVQAQVGGREKDEVKIQKAYMGAEIQMNDKSEIISIIQSSEGMEYFLTTSIKKLSLQEKPLVGILQGHGEKSPEELSFLVHSLSVLNDVQPVTLNDSTSALDKFQTLAIISPSDSFSSSELTQLDNFLAAGKGIFVALNRVHVDPSREAMGHTINTGLETWLAEKGIIVNENFVLDQTNMPVGIQQEAMTPFGPSIVTRQIEFPFFPIAQNFAEHAVTAGLQNILFRFVSSINFSGDSSLVFTPLVLTSEHSGTQSVSAWLNYMKEWNEADFPLSNVTVAASLEGQIKGTMPSKMVVVADGDILEPMSQQGPHPDNLNLVVSSVDWLSDDTGLIELRTKGAKSRPIKEDLTDGKRTFLKFLNFLLPIVLIIIIGIIRFEIRRNQRIKRMEVGYV